MVLEIRGIDEVIEELDDARTKVRRHLNKVLKESAEPLKEEIISRTPAGEGDAKSDVHISNVRSENEGMNQFVEVGYGKETGWIMYFHEFGTYQYFSKAYSPKTHSLGSKGVPSNRAIGPKHMVETSTAIARPKVLAIQKEMLNDYLHIQRKS